MPGSRVYKDANGKVCTGCGEYLLYFNVDSTTNFPRGGNNKEGFIPKCKTCHNLLHRKWARANQYLIKAPTFPLSGSLRKARWVCKKHADRPSNHYLNYRGHRVCRKCHFDSIVKANRERKRRLHPEWKPLKRSTYIKRLRSRRKTERSKKRAAAKAAKQQPASLD